jgi:hypothetical protein
MRAARRRPFAIVAALAYFFVAAILPPGHMAAPLASGTAFHLCPGDLRSAQVLAAIAVEGDHAAHGVGHGIAAAHDASGFQSNDHGPAASAAEVRFDSGCGFSGAGSAALIAEAPALDIDNGDSELLAVAPGNTLHPRRWLRPAPRSPPA